MRLCRSFLLLLLFFFFYCYGDHRDLHSFPTRRSSDLHGACRRGLAVARPPRRGRVVLRARRQVQRLGWRRAPVDRKSTRLNSSHRCISYAVFCLKKKKKKKKTKK